MLRFLVLVLSLYSPRPDLNDAVRFWQRELYLQDWKVSVEVVSRAELADSTLGDIVPDGGTKTAVIRVLRDSEYNVPPRQARSEQRLTIAHEMVHLYRYVYSGVDTWRDEAATTAETYSRLQFHRRWRELLVAEP